MTREEIITNMCYTWRHDFGLDRDPENVLSSGTTQEERESLWSSMAQIFDTCIVPNVSFKARKKRDTYIGLECARKR